MCTSLFLPQQTADFLEVVAWHEQFMPRTKNMTNAYILNMRLKLLKYYSVFRKGL